MDSKRYWQLGKVNDLICILKFFKSFCSFFITHILIWMDHHCLITKNKKEDRSMTLVLIFQEWWSNNTSVLKTWETVLRLPFIEIISEVAYPSERNQGQSFADLQFWHVIVTLYSFLFISLFNLFVCFLLYWDFVWVL